MSSKDINISKTLSWLLRHGAVKEGIQISREGFVNVTDILNHESLRNRYTLDDIKRVVDTNDKQRFKLRCNNNVWEICANQGHSLKIVEDPNLVPILEGNDIQVIHGTYNKYWPLIKEKGLSRMNRNHIHFAPGLPGDKVVISGMRKTAEVFIYINLPLALSEGITFFKSANGVILSPGINNGLIDSKYFLKLNKIHAMYKATKRKRSEDMEESNEKDATNAKKAKYLICEWCKIELPNEASMRQHLLGQKHKKLNDAEEDRRRVEQKCGLFIRGFPPNFDRDSILAYFSQFGKIVWVYFDHSFLLLDYDDPDAAKTVLSRSHYLGGQRLMIKYRQLRKQVPVRAPKKEETNDFVQKLKDIPNFDDQVELLGQNLQPASQHQFPKYNKLCEDLYNVLSQSFPYCRIHPFGSTITGLGFNNSDVDVFVSGVKKGNKDVPFLYRAKSLLINSQLFTNVLVIPQAKIPILKCVHVLTGINCDINLKNMLGVCNSHLINYYLNLDSKLRKIMIVLKFWAKTHKITGQNHLFTNYSLNLMLIFFLQHSPFQFPSVLMLQQNPQFFNNQDGWNGGFQPIQFMSSKLYHVSLLKLLEMFFSFYVEYEYGINIICPYLGVSVKKQAFKELENLADCYQTYKKYVAENGQPLKVDGAVCVQDPFEHSRNTTPIVSAATLETFVSFCRLGKKFCEEADGPILFKLLTEVPPNLAALTIVKSQSSQFTISMRPGLKYIEEKHELGPERHKAWFESLVNFTKVALKDILKFNLIDVSDPTSKTKHKKADGQSDVYAEMTPVCFKCNGKLNLWQARKSAAKSKKPEDEEPKKGIVEKELAVTEQLSILYKDISQVDDIIDFEISLEHFVDPPKVVIDIKKVAAYKNSFKSFVTFLSANLPAWFKNFEQEQNEYV